MVPPTRSKEIVFMANNNDSSEFSLQFVDCDINYIPYVNSKQLKMIVKRHGHL